MKIAIYPVVFAIMTLFTPLYAQEISERSEQEPESFTPYHSFGVSLNHAHVREGVTEGNRQWINLPAWGIDYNYFFHEHWAIGAQIDVITQDFLVRRHFGGEEEEAIERQTPIAPAIMGMYRINHHWGMKLGLGAEFEAEESFFLTRIGVEYMTPLFYEDWELFGTLSYDIKWAGYDTLVIGIGVARLFGE